MHRPSHSARAAIASTAATPAVMGSLLKGQNGYATTGRKHDRDRAPERRQQYAEQRAAELGITVDQWRPWAFALAEQRQIACVTCGGTFDSARANAKYCSAECRPRRIRWGPKQKSSAQRGYGNEHRKRRRELLPQAYGTPCGLCNVVMHEGDPTRPGPLKASCSWRSARRPHLFTGSATEGQEPSSDERSSLGMCVALHLWLTSTHRWRCGSARPADPRRPR